MYFLNFFCFRVASSFRLEYLFHFFLFCVASICRLEYFLNLSPFASRVLFVSRILFESSFHFFSSCVASISRREYFLNLFPAVSQVIFVPRVHFKSLFHFFPFASQVFAVSNSFLIFPLSHRKCHSSREYFWNLCTFASSVFSVSCILRLQYCLISCFFVSHVYSSHLFS